LESHKHYDRAVNVSGVGGPKTDLFLLNWQNPYNQWTLLLKKQIIQVHFKEKLAEINGNRNISTVINSHMHSVFESTQFGGWSTHGNWNRAFIFISNFWGF